MKTNAIKNSILLSLFMVIIPLISIEAQKSQKYIDELMKVDTEFSDFSVANGMNKAFFEYSDESVVLLKPDMLPIKGMEELKRYHKNIDDTQFKLSWSPNFAKSGKKGDIGYTYGTWKMTGDNLDFEGTYVTIWSKNKDGKWKVVLDSGNGGLGKKK